MNTPRIIQLYLNENIKIQRIFYKKYFLSCNICKMSSNVIKSAEYATISFMSHRSVPTARQREIQSSMRIDYQAFDVINLAYLPLTGQFSTLILVHSAKLRVFSLLQFLRLYRCGSFWHNILVKIYIEFCFI